MILRKNENPIIWEQLIIKALTDFADLETQKKNWLGEDEKYISSFTETLAFLYDDADFPRFIEYCEAVQTKNVLSENLKAIDNMIKGYKEIGYKKELEPNGSQSILHDPKWIEISDKAKQLIKLWEVK